MKVLMADACNYHGPTHVGSHAYAEAFMDDAKEVMWLGTPLTIKNFVVNKRWVGDDVRTRIRAWRRGGEAIAPRGIAYYPLTMLPVVDKPFFRTRFALKRTLAWTLPPVKSVIARHGFHEPDLLWLSQSLFSQPMRELVKARRTCYRMSDDWTHFGTVSAALVATEGRIIEEVDAVFVTSKRLKEKLHGVRPDAVYLPNGVDDAFFEPGAPEPPPLRQFGRPRVIFVGTISSWVDDDLIRRSAARLPDVSFILAGPAPQRNPFESPTKNVCHLGVIPYRDVPAYLNSCDVAIIPFRRNELTHAASPVKLFEYLASGVPVLSVRLDEIEGLGSPAILADDEDAFVERLAGLIRGEIPWDRRRAISFARGHTWRNRYELVKSTLGI